MNTDANRRAFAEVEYGVVPHDDPGTRVVAVAAGGPVGRTVVHHDHLLCTAIGKRCLQNPLHHAVKRSKFAVNRNDD